MINANLQKKVSGSDWLVNVVSDCLQLPADKIDRDVPLVRYGLDSLGAVRLITAISAELQRDVPDALLLYHPDIHSLELFIRASREKKSGVAAQPSQVPVQLDQMLADSILPEDIRPDPGAHRASPAKSLLLTGATGFLGAYLLRALLRDTPADIYCFARRSESNPQTRIRCNLEHYGIWKQEFESRVHVVEGDLQKPNLGISRHEFETLARDIDEIYHCGASVNWVFPYSGLRDTNVIGTREMLRLACSVKPKSFHFVSTMATCYSSNRRDEVTEQDDMLPYLDSIHLGYAQSKCVAESLVRRASERGLPATIHRPSLISGDGTTGFSNEDDLLSNMIRGCIQMGSTPDLDWVLDCCPVDYAADAIVGLSRQTDDSLRVFHLANPVSRHWREFVLWINLFGFPLQLVPYRDWLAEMRTAAATPQHPLYRLRSFFLAKPSADTDLTLPELYEEHRCNPISQTHTQQLLLELPLACPHLDAKLLDRYFTSFIERQVLPNVTSPEKERPLGQRDLNAEFFQNVLRRHYDDDLMQVDGLTLLHDNSKESITTELTSWQYGNSAGLWKYRVDFGGNRKDLPRSQELFVKVKPLDQDVLVVSEKVAAMCDDKVGQAFARHKHRLGITGSHVREISVYRQEDLRFQSHVPEVIAAIGNESVQQWVLVLESLSQLELLDSANDVSGWRPAHMEAAIGGIAQIHSIWYQREQELSEKSWLGPKMSSSSMSEMTDLWESLADYSWKYFSKWVDPDTQPLVAELIADVGQWWRTLEQMPHTLVHNDFNPRNIAFRNQDGQLRLCAYDWELAAPGIPQHDLAELLCFVLPSDCSLSLVRHYVELHRIALSQASGRSIETDSWRLGFQLALRDLILNRLPMYCLMQTFRPQPFLPRVVRTWRRLHDLLSDDLQK